MDYLRGQPNSFTADLQLNYFGGRSPHYGVDQLDTAVGAKRLFVSEDGITRVVGFKKNGFAVITSSVIFGALADGDLENSKMYLLSEYLNYLITDDGVGVTENNNLNKSFVVYPNPFTDRLNIHLPEISGVGSLEIIDINGQIVFRQTLQPQQKIAEWYGNDNNGCSLKSGLYIIRITDHKNQYLQKVQKL